MDYDAIIIGSGQGGGPLASAFAKAKRRTLLVERAHIGGTCVNEGCTPTKTMVASARVAYLARRAADYGVTVSAPTVDMRRVRDRKAAVVESFRAGDERRIEKAGVEIRRGQARFVGRRTVEIRSDGETTTVSASLVFINTGLRPTTPAVPGIESVGALDSTSIMELDTLPEHLIVLGGGYVGLEFAQMFRRFGSRVTVLQRNAQLLPKEDPDIAEVVTAILREDGIDVQLGVETLGATRSSPRDVHVRYRLSAGATGSRSEITVDGSHLLVAAGRAPNTSELGLDVAGVRTDAHGYVRVNSRLETTAKGVYALGDVNGGPAFTHVSYDDYRILKTNLLEDGNRTTEGRIIPHTLFIDPQLGRVGLTERGAREAGYDVRVATLTMSHVARALETDESRGVLKAVVDAGSSQILGVAALGIDGGEIASLLQVAMMGGLPYTSLRDGVFAHPTLAESVNNLFAKLAIG
jgi:pyruvate/2-oxoglutarate dehydrogenase complex dihydrolipoamide dehydrogenase (E3) component